MCDFEPAEVLEKYPSGWEGVLDDIVAQLKPRGSVPRTSRSIWPSYCRSVLSGARFLSGFSSAEEFYGWVDFFDEDERARTRSASLHFSALGAGGTTAVVETTSPSQTPARTARSV